MSNYQDRVVEEKTSLDKKIKDLNAFIKTDKHNDLDVHERLRLDNQLDVMHQYSSILNERINSFPVL